MTQELEKTKNIVIFGANGGIGYDVVRRISEAIAAGENYSVTLVSRKNEQYTQAQIMELAEAISATGIADGVDLLGNLKIGPVFNPTKLEDLKTTLENADMVVCAAGLPRPNPPPARSALIYPNAPVVKDVATAVAKYAPATTPLLLGTNPLDNTVQIANETLKEEWKKANRTEKLPEVKVFGMAGTLDEARLRIYASKTLNKALGVTSQADATEKRLPYVKPQDVTGNVFGQHGPAMVVDLKSVKIKDTPLDDFITQNTTSAI